MLDVHAPHAPTRSWREFLVHILAIAIGLLLALALEKFAEYVHERRQLREARRELATEVAENRRKWALNMTEAFRVQQELTADLKTIQVLRSKKPAASGKFDYSVHFFAALDGPWQAVRQSGSLNLMPHEELQTYAWFHQILTSLMESMHALESNLYIAGAIAASTAPDQLNAHDLDQLADRTLEAQGRLEDFRMFLSFEQGGLESLSARSSAAAH